MAMAEKTIRVCDRCGKLPAETVGIVMADGPIVGRDDWTAMEHHTLDLCGKCQCTVSAAILRATKPIKHDREETGDESAE